MDLLVNLSRVLRYRQLKLSVFVSGMAMLVAAGCNSSAGPVGKDSSQPATVQGASMFPAIPGNHFELKCQACYGRFKIDGDNIPSQRMAVCPNCGFGNNTISPTEKKQSSVLSVDKIVEPIERWDVVAFTIPKRLQSGGVKGVKRVVGLPGESVRISGGEIVVDGKIAACDFEQKREMLIAVHDNQFLPLTVVSRWVAEEGWEKTGRSWDFAPQKSGGKMRWLTYLQKRNYRKGAGSAETIAIQDIYPCNQNLARSLNKVRDLVIDAEVIAGPNALMNFLFESGADATEFEFDFTKRKVKVLRSASQLQTAGLPRIRLGEQFRLEVSNCDRQATVAINGHVILESEWRGARPSSIDRAAKLSIGCKQDSVSLKRIKVFRDNYYLSQGGGDGGSWSLGSDEYLLLGDNGPVSVDSRQFGPISETNIIGLINLN